MLHKLYNILLSISLSLYCFYPAVCNLIDTSYGYANYLDFFYNFLSGLFFSSIALVLLFFKRDTLKNKLKLCILPACCLLLFFYSNSFSTQIGEYIFITNNHTQLEHIANNVLNGTTTIEQANKTLNKHYGNINLSYIENNNYVCFITFGLVDNCAGYCYAAKQQTKPNSENFTCGELTSWSHIKGSWYSFTTT